MKLSTKMMIGLLCGTALTGFSTAASAQDVPAEEPTAGSGDPEIVVTGSQIRGAKVDDVLPVTVVGEKNIDAIDPASGDELFRAIPQAGSVDFNEQSTAGGVNGARGDIASINLRGLGTGNTLLLVNGRRMVLNPGFQTELFVPVVSPDTNTILPGSIRRVEILRDGASAVYGADAVAGVVNTILRGGRDGGFIQGNYRVAPGTDSGSEDLYSYSLRGGFGFDFADGRGNLTVYGYYFHENGIPASSRDFSANSDQRSSLIGTDFEGDTQFDNRSINSAFGAFDIQGSSATSSNTTSLRDDDFHIQPCSLFGSAGQPSDGRFIDLGNGLCADNGGTIDRDLRFNLAGDRRLYSEKDRYSASALFNYEISDAVEFYAEGSYYRTKSNRTREQNTMLSAVPLGIEATAFWNPLGATTLADGSPNPNRVTNGIGSGVTAAGRALLLEDYRFIDAGPRQGIVTKDTYRAVAGLRGDLFGWDFDAGLLYSQADTNDLTLNRISSTLAQAAINRTDATAYNPFNGGCFPGAVGNSNIDCTPNSQAVIDDITIDVFRNGQTTLALADFKVSKPDVFTLPGGDVGLAMGVEFRRETFKDDRDPRLDGTITFTNAVNGDTFGSDVLGSSPSPSTGGNREVYSAFAEALIPVVSDDMEIPLVERLEVQLAARFEDFSDSTSAFVPRAAAAWTPFDGLLLRGAWSQGFRAPNLIQINDAGTTRSNTVTHIVECIAEIISGAEDDVPDCGGVGTIDFRSGSADLKPEKTESVNLGVVVSPPFIPGLTLTADYWRVKQDGIVGIFGSENAILLDLILRSQGSSNPNVIRDAPDAGQIALYAGTGLNPAGDIQQILNPYRNLDARTSEGLDFGLFYEFDTGFGDFTIELNAARLLSFVQEAGPDAQPLIDDLNPLLATFPLSIGDVAALQPFGFGELLEIDGRPKWRYSGSITWDSGPVRMNVFGRYVGKVFDPGAQNDVTAAFFPVDDWFTMNASISYTFDNDTALDGTRIRFGINNLLDQDPPLADESYGFYGSLHSGRGRQFSVDIRKNF